MKKGKIILRKNNNRGLKNTSSCSIINNNLDMNKLINSMSKFNINKIPLSNIMKDNLDKLGINYEK